MTLQPLPLFLKLNEAMALRAMVECAQSIDRNWDKETERREVLIHLIAMLEAAAQHPSPTIKSLNHLARKITLTDPHSHFLNILVPLERQYSRAVVDHDFLVVENDKSSPLAPPLPVTVVLENIRSAFNVGSIFRTAECFGLQRLWLTGYTPTPEMKHTQATAMGTHEHVTWSHMASLQQAEAQLHEGRIPVIALEHTNNSTPITKFAFPMPCALILGNERYGVDRSILRTADHTVHIPMYGRKNSLNVGIAFGVVAAEIRRQYPA